VVLHDEEATESTVTAKNVANMFAAASSKVSAHYTVDVDEIVQCVDEKDAAWAAGPIGNLHGIHIEMSGYARDTTEQWLNDMQMLDLCAQLVADICTRNGLPTTVLEASDLDDSACGITTHAAISAKYHETTHTDPGPSFPMTQFMELVNKYYAPPPAAA
jgi:N-acetyl-anhydromuramyl-L-alanine amidase AmpD